MLAVTRRQEIAWLVRDLGAVAVSELSGRFGVTEETIRKDLEKLEAEGLLKRKHGGAVAVDDDGRELPFAVRNASHMAEKRRIAAAALPLVRHGEVIALDASSTCLQLAYLLKEIPDLTVVTNSLHIVQALKDSPAVTVFCAGGYLRTPSYCFVGETAEEMLGRYVIGKAFLSTRGLTLEHGLLEPNELEARIKKTMIRQAEELVVLQDFSKFGKSAFYPIAPLERMDCLITDGRAPAGELEAIRRRGVSVIIAEAEGGERSP